MEGLQQEQEQVAAHLLATTITTTTTIHATTATDSMHTVDLLADTGRIFPDTRGGRPCTNPWKPPTSPGQLVHAIRV
jgi:hypothetical protein